MSLSYEEMKLISEMVWTGIYNGNHIEPKAFDPTPEQYRMLCDIANRMDDKIKEMQNMYGLK